MSQSRTSAPGRRRHGLTALDKRDPIGVAVAVLNRLARMPALDRLGPQLGRRSCPSR